MKKTYKELTPFEAMQKLIDNKGPVKNLVFSDNSHTTWDGNSYIRTLVGVSLNDDFPFSTITQTDEEMPNKWKHCAELIETPPQPWTLETVPMGYMLIRDKDQHNCIVLALDRTPHGIHTKHEFRAYAKLAEYCEYSLDNGVTWGPCTS